MTMYRQGDLLFIETLEKPNGIKKHDKIVLASTITGHSHAITRGDVYVNEPKWDDRANFYVVIPEGGAEIVHQEHGSIPLKAGVYKVIRQREVKGYVKD